MNGDNILELEGRSLRTGTKVKMRKCDWCGKPFSLTIAACGTGTTWMLYKCPHCEKFIAMGWAIPDGAYGPDTKIIKTEPIGSNALRPMDNRCPPENKGFGPEAGPAKEVHTPVGSDAPRSPPGGGEGLQCTCLDRDRFTPIRCPMHGPAIERGAQRPFPPKTSNSVPPEDARLAHILWRNAKQHKSLLEQQYGFGGIGGTIKRRAPCVLGCFAGNPDEMTCPYCGQSAPIEKGVARCSNEDCRAVIRPGGHLTEIEKLAHTRWRNAKQLIGLLEKEYGFGQKHAPYIGNDVGKPTTGAYSPLPPGFRAGTDFGQEEPRGRTLVRLGVKIREKGTEWPVYHLGKNVQAKEIDGKFEYFGSEANEILDMLRELEAKGELELLGKSGGRLIIHGEDGPLRQEVTASNEPAQGDAVNTGLEANALKQRGFICKEDYEPNYGGPYEDKEDAK